MSYVDPSGLKIYDPGGIIPSWIKNTPLYKELDSAFAIITVEDYAGNGDEGETTSTAFGRWQTIKVDRCGSKTTTNPGLTPFEDTVLHEFVHAQQNLSRYRGGPSKELSDQLLMPSIFTNSLKFKK